MIPLFSLDDITTRRTREDGSATPIFDRAKAASAILSKMRLAVEVFDSREDQPEIWYYDNGYWHPGAASLISYFLDKVAGNLSDSKNINDVLRRIRGELRLRPVEFDITNPYLVGCKGGITVDLRTGEARKASPQDLISLPIPVRYDPNAKCPNFIQFLEDVTATDDDKLSIIDFLASLLISEPMDFFVAAPGLGSNGRTVLKNLIRAFVGSDACRSIPLKDLSNRFTAGFLTRTRVNFCNETEIGGIALEFIKRSSEKMPVEQKFKGMVNAMLYLKFFFDTNTMPVIADSSYGAERRLCRWDMPWRFVDNPNGLMEKQRDPYILSRLTTEEELSGILNLVLERAPEVIRQKMIHHRKGGLQEYALQSRSGDVFVDLFLLATNNVEDRVHTNTIREAYLEYCRITNSSILPAKALKTLIEERLGRLQERNLKIEGANRSGFRAVKFDQEMFNNILSALKVAREQGFPVFQILLKMCPDLENSTNSTSFYRNSTFETSSSSILGRIVEKYRGKKKEDRTEEERIDLEKTLLSLPFSTKVALDSENQGRIEVEEGRKIGEKKRKPQSSALEAEISAVVEEFLRDGGKASRQRFLAEFPEAAG